MLLATLRTYLKPYARNIALVILFQLLATRRRSTCPR